MTGTRGGFLPLPPCPRARHERAPEDWSPLIAPTLADPDPRPSTPTATLDFARAVAVGLTDSPKWLPSRFLYDATGSELFEDITRLPEYYLTRAEASILERRASEICDLTGPVTLIELGSGSSRKTGHLLGAYRAGGERVRYVPVDVSETALQLAHKVLGEAHPEVEVEGIVGTYQVAFRQFREHSPCLVLFLGSTIGNFDLDEAVAFWSEVAAALPEGDHFLLGVDLVKDRRTLEAAYNDTAGVSARFTRNVFARINRELGAAIDLDQLEHVARWNADWQRIEIFARFRDHQVVHLAPIDLSVEIAAGDTVLTEISRKFVLDDIRRHVTAFGFRVVRAFTDTEDRFGLLLLRRQDEDHEELQP